MITRIRYIVVISIFLISSACGIKRGVVHDFSVGKVDIPVFIEIPKNNLVFENTSPLVYDVFSDHFERVGYHLVTKPSEGYTLRIIVKSLDPIYKYVSPDVVLFHATFKLELCCQLLNYVHDVVAQKSFTFTMLISKPQNPILNSDFLDFSYTRLLKKAAPKIEQFFRSFLLKSVN
jgi:hypothetical protein